MSVERIHLRDLGLEGNAANVVVLDRDSFEAFVEKHREAECEVARLRSTLEGELPVMLKHLTLGELIRKLEGLEGDRPVVYDFPGQRPSLELSSYRGDYSELALGIWSEGTPAPRDACVKSLLGELKAATRRRFSGYKGGDYQMHEDTKVWVAEYGDASQVAIVGVYGDTGYSAVVLATARVLS